MEKINYIVIHCAATQNGKKLSHNAATAAQVIDGWHQERGFHRSAQARHYFNYELAAIGYHFVIDTDGQQYTGRALWEQGAHVKGWNKNSLAVCLVGTDKYTGQQWHALKRLLDELKDKYPNAQIVGHRDFPNVHKSCPGFSVKEYLFNMEKVVNKHLCE